MNARVLVRLTCGLLLVPAACARARGEVAMDYATFRVSGLECVIGNNAEAGEHRPGYNGVFSMRMPGVSDSAFVPAYAGLNLEHFFDARPRNEDRAIFMEPRHAPMTFTRSDEFTAELYQPPTPVYGVESWTRFQLREPNRIDMAFRCIPHKAVFEGGFMGVFWASYIQAPLDKSVYFLDAGSTLDKPQWVQYCTQVHGRDSTVLHEDAAEMPLPPMANDGSLFNSLSPLRYGEPFFYGRFRDQVLIYLFDDDPRIRFSHSPSGGGMTAAGDAANPAWDFQFVVSGYEVGREYGFRMSLIAKRWESREDVIAEVRNVMCQP